MSKRGNSASVKSLIARRGRSQAPSPVRIAAQVRLEAIVVIHHDLAVARKLHIELRAVAAAPRHRRTPPAYSRDATSPPPRWAMFQGRMAASTPPTFSGNRTVLPAPICSTRSGARDGQNDDFQMQFFRRRRWSGANSMIVGVPDSMSFSDSSKWWRKSSGGNSSDNSLPVMSRAEAAPHRSRRQGARENRLPPSIGSIDRDVAQKACNRPRWHVAADDDAVRRPRVPERKQLLRFGSGLAHRQ